MVACTTSSNKRADIAISDVNVTELLEMYDVTGGVKLTALTRKPLAMQGFAVAVNNKFYNALQNAQVASGALPSTCATATVTGTGANAVTTYSGNLYTEACQPSITRAQFASLVSKDGITKNAASFIPGDTTKLILSRRDQLSGTQASSNMYFASGVCNVLDSKSKVNTHGGALTVARATDFPASSTFEIRERVQSGDVKTDLAITTDYVIGVLSLDNGNSTTFKFVKVDGASPNFAKGGQRPNGSAEIPAAAAVTASPAVAASPAVGVEGQPGYIPAVLAKDEVKAKDAVTFQAATPNLRANLIDGTWGFQMAAYGVYQTAQATYDAKKAPKAGLIVKVASDLSDSTLNSLPIGYIDGTSDATKKSLVRRLDSNNCSPLIYK